VIRSTFALRERCAGAVVSRDMAGDCLAATSLLNPNDRDRREVIRMPIPSTRLAPANVWRFEVVSQTLIPSDRCRPLYGLPPDAPFTYAEFCAAVHPDDREMQSRELSHAVETGRLNAKIRVIWPDGSVHRIQLLGSVSPPVTGKPLQIVGASIGLGD
jgi:PAS fold